MEEDKVVIFSSFTEFAVGPNHFEDFFLIWLVHLNGFFFLEIFFFLSIIAVFFFFLDLDVLI